MFLSCRSLELVDSSKDDLLSCNTAAGVGGMVHYSPDNIVPVDRVRGAVFALWRPAGMAPV